jgi:hypothetical protein
LLPGHDYSSNITATYYLDSVLLRRSVQQLPKAPFCPDPVILDFLGDFRTDQAFISQYFALIHPWIPFLSKKAFRERTVNPLSSAWPWNVLLLTAMRLLTTPLLDPNPRSTFYITLRANVCAAVDSGLIEIRIYQAMLLVAAYELGHGIYPAAYMTVGTCIRYGTALGLDRSLEGGSGHPQDDLEAEERRRSWWTVLLLDKYLSLGFTDRKPMATCPGKDAMLPADDGLWEKADQTQIYPRRLTEPLSAEMGRFCLTAQVVILLERIVQNISDTSSHDEFRKEEAKALDDTAAALTNVALEEARSRGINVCSPVTACYSARMLLRDPERAGTLRPETPDGHTVEFEIAGAMLTIARTACALSRPCGEEEYEPFCLEAQYRCGIFFARRYQSHENHEDLEALESIKNMLRVVNGRWKLAGLYLQMLEARSLSGIL